MNKSTAIISGVQIGVTVVNILIAIRRFAEGKIVVGLIFSLLALFLISQLLSRSRRHKPRCTVEIHKLSDEEAQEFLKMMGEDIEGVSVMTKREAQELQERVEELEKENADLRKQNTELKEIIKEYGHD